MKKESSRYFILAILLVALFGIISYLLSHLEFFKSHAISPLVIGIVLGIIFGNTLRHKLKKEYDAGILFSSKKILRAGIVLYGFQITFQEIASVGLGGFMSDLFMVVSTFLLGSILGIKIMKLDRDTSFLTSSGASICGAAAVLATDGVLKAEGYKVSLAVATVVIFGTISMFVYPLIYSLDILPLTQEQFGVYIGASVHEVAQVVAAGNAIGGDGAAAAVISKMTRVMIMAPFLILFGYWFVKKYGSGSKSKTSFPLFAILFVGVAAFNSIITLPEFAKESIQFIDIFLLTMAMSALGMETNLTKFKNVGIKPFILATILFIWLLVGGFLSVYIFSRLF